MKSTIQVILMRMHIFPNLTAYENDNIEETEGLRKRQNLQFCFQVFVTAVRFQKEKCHDRSRISNLPVKEKIKRLKIRSLY